MGSAARRESTFRSVGRGLFPRGARGADACRRSRHARRGRSRIPDPERDRGLRELHREHGLSRRPRRSLPAARVHARVDARRRGLPAGRRDLAVSLGRAAPSLAGRGMALVSRLAAAGPRTGSDRRSVASGPIYLPSAHRPLHRRGVGASRDLRRLAPPSRAPRRRRRRVPHFMDPPGARPARHVARSTALH